MTTTETISAWFDRGVAEGATHMAVICDTYDWSDYPHYVSTDENVREALRPALNGENMMRLMEVYNLSMDKSAQLAEHRAFHWESE